MLVSDERIDHAAGDYCFVPRGVPHAYVVRSERPPMLVTISPSGTEQLFVSLGVPVTSSERPTQTPMSPMPKLVRLFATHGSATYAVAFRTIAAWRVDHRSFPNTADAANRTLDGSLASTELRASFTCGGY